MVELRFGCDKASQFLYHTSIPAVTYDLHTIYKDMFPALFLRKIYFLRQAKTKPYEQT